MKAEIIASGTELLLGESTDANTSFLAGQLALLGIDVYYTSIVGDNYERYSKVLKQAWDRSDLIITTGGLGPTRGDITREVIAGLVGEEIAVDDCLRKEISDFFARIGAEMPENNLRQATIIRSATALHNIAGTAPGWWVEKGGRVIIALPGPPAEMQAMWRGEVLPKLESGSAAIILSRTLKTWGISEAKLDQQVAPFLSCANPTLALYAKQDGIHLRITAKASTRDAAEDMLAHREHEIKEVLKGATWGADNDTMEGVVGKLLVNSGKTVAVAETVTGGLLANVLASSTGSNKYFRGSVLLNSDESSGEFGQQSEPISAKASTISVLHLASRVRSFLNADIGLAIDGHCKTAANEFSCTIFIAIDEGSKNKVFQEKYSGLMQQISRRTINYALVNFKKYLTSE